MRGRVTQLSKRGIHLWYMTQRLFVNITVPLRAQLNELIEIEYGTTLVHHHVHTGLTRTSVTFTRFRLHSGKLVPNGCCKRFESTMNQFIRLQRLFYVVFYNVYFKKYVV